MSKTLPSFRPLVCLAIILSPFKNSATAQVCSGSWVSNHPLAYQCISGQLIGVPSTGPGSNQYAELTGCPISPLYPGVQSNTFIFNNPINDFVVDFNAFSSTPGCARLQVKINGIFYPLNATNLVELPMGNTCNSSVDYLAITADGYITGSSTSTLSTNGQGRLIFSGVNASSITFSSNDAGGGSVFTSPCSPIVVPLKLLSFKGIESLMCTTVLSWETGTESNVHHIEIMRSEDGSKFLKVADILPKGNNSFYKFETQNSSTAFFKLRIIDFDGHFEYSKLIQVKSHCPALNYEITPNPSFDYIEILSLKENDKIVIMDLLGRIMITHVANQNNSKIDIHNLSSGIYILQIVNSNLKRTNIKFIKS